MKKNIGLLVPSMNSGGAERVVSRLSNILNDKYNIFVILFEDTYMTYECGGTIINLGIRAQSKNTFAKFLLPFRRAIKLKKIKRTKALDVVISFMDSPNIVNILSRTVNCKTVISIRNFNYVKWNPLFKILIKIFYSKADSIIAVSKVICEEMIKNYNRNAVTIYNPYDIEQIKKSVYEDLDEDYEHFFIDKDVFISVGRHMYQKGFWHLIKAFKIVHDVNNSVRLVIVGRDESDGKAAKLARDLGLEDSVLFTGYQKNPFKYIFRSCVYVLSSLFEGFPNSMVEAMACGCPVIAADCKSGPREILYENPDLETVSTSIEKADYGILVPPLDFEENWDFSVVNDTELPLAEAMLIYLENGTLNEYYANKVVERAKAFSYDRCKQDFEDVIEMV
jgi:glycosyltransferase involved in cell wall biosynthesis